MLREFRSMNYLTTAEGLTRVISQVSWVQSELVSVSPKVHSVISIADAGQFHSKGTAWRKLLDSSLYDLSKLMARKCPHFFEPKSEEFKAYLNRCFDAWCAAFTHFDTLKLSMIEYSSTRQLSFPAYMKQYVNKTLLAIRRKDLERSLSVSVFESK